MKLGVASAAAQIEGGDVRHTWNDWADRGHILDGSSPRRANDHVHVFQSDIGLMREMGVQVYRLGIEWARVEPCEGAFDPDAVLYYRKLLECVKENGIEPMVTLHHFANPMWFEESGGFADAKNAGKYLSYVRRAVRAFGDIASEYVTVNEPNVFAVQGYLAGGFPPGEKNPMKALKVMSVMAGCHVKAYQIIHEERRAMGFAGTKVGFAHHMRAFAPQNAFNPWHQLCAKLGKALFQGLLSNACLRGRFGWPLTNPMGVRPGEYADFLGLNYYTRSTVSSLSDGVRQDVEVNDLGWEIYPEGIAECARELYAVLGRPIYVTENGTCDEHDTFRARYIAEHLRSIVKTGLPVERYYHWCFTDNFEWLEGESARFGLVKVDYDSQARSVKRSGEFFGRIIKNQGVTREMGQLYIADAKYPRNDRAAQSPAPGTAV